MTPKTCAQVMRALHPVLSEEEHVDRLLAAMAEDQRLEMVLPALPGMNVLLEGDLSEEVREKIFDGFAGLGFDRAMKVGR